MKKIFCAIIVLLAVAGCSGPEDRSFDFEKEGGTEIIISVDAKDFLIQESGYSEYLPFNMAIAQTTFNDEIRGEEYIEKFIVKFSEINPGGKLNHVFIPTDNQKYNLWMSDEELKKELIKEFGYAKERTEQVLKSRLLKFGLKKFNIIQIPTGFKIQIGDEIDQQRICGLLQSSANLGFYETYTNTDVYQNILDLNDFISSELKKDTAIQESLLINEADTNKINYPLFSLITLNIYSDERGLTYFNDGALFGYVLQKDTAMVNDYLKTYRTGKLPPDLQFAWSAEEEELGNIKNVFGLYLIKTRNIRISEISGNHVIEAEEMVNKLTNEIQVRMVFNADGSEKWQQLTRKNLSKNIAIMLDGSVYNCPIVQQEITGGVAVISGNFTEEEAKDLAAVLSAGTLPCRVRITGSKTVKGK